MSTDHKVSGVDISLRQLCCPPLMSIAINVYLGGGQVSLSNGAIIGAQYWPLRWPFGHSEVVTARQSW